MKTFLTKLCLLLFLIYTVQSYAQNFNNSYALINVFNTAGENLHDFEFSYDVIGGQHTCNNNFTVISKTGAYTAFNFKIFINGVDTYTGKVAMPAFGKVFFNNSFVNCYSSDSKILVQIIP
ncbi:hypothetical protein [Chryseobacterium sp. CT-SW4]|uniref:hypothetical protein n=1 Tax=Chryseobacterium sp. SW-1 TaxID=3157343 RepID=UPI003B021A31